MPNFSTHYFGVIRGNSVPETVSDIMSYGTNLTYAAAIEEGLDEDEDYEGYEDQYLYEQDGVKLLLEWLGGAIIIFVVESPYLCTNATQCSPCVPMAGDLDSIGGTYTCFSLPPDWYEDEEDRTIILETNYVG